MYALNKCQIIGHLTQAPEVRQTPTGQTVGDLNVIIRQSFVNSTGQTQLSTSFVNVVVWRGLADISQRFLKKGSQVFISGRIQTDEWEDQDGQKRYKTRVVADDLILLDPRNPNPPIAQDSAIGQGLNQAEVIGNVTRDPEMRQTSNGENVCSFGVATNFAWKDRSGQEQQRTEYHNVVVWGSLAKDLGETLRKGRKIYIAGRLQTRSWDTPDGQKKWTTEIVTDRALALGTVDHEIGSVDSVSTANVSSASMPANSPTSTVSQVNINQPSANVSNAVVPQNPTSVPAINYEPEIKPEDLPF